MTETGSDAGTGRGKMGKEFDYFLAGIALVCGILLLSGHGEILMRGGNERERNKKYDQKKMERACGVAALVLGVATLVDSYMGSVPFTIGYVIFIVLIFAVLIYYIKKHC